MVITNVNQKTKEELLEEFARQTTHNTLEGEQYSAAIMVKAAQDVAIGMELLQKQIPITVSELRQTISGGGDRTIAADKKLADSNDRHSQFMALLTIALTMAAVIQALSAWAQWHVSEAAIDVQRDANGIERAKWNYEMMRNDRLEARDVDWRRIDLEMQKN